MREYILVTGGAGYVGHRLVPLLLESGHKVIVYDLMIFGCYLQDHPNLLIIKGDIRNTQMLEMYLPICHTVIHLACISNDPSCDLDSKLTASINLVAFDPLVRSAKECGVTRFINASSSSVYGVKKESEVTEYLKCDPLTLYSKFKLECEEILKEYYDEDTFKTISVRSATVFGHSIRMRFDTVLNMFCLHAHYGAVTINGGEQVRPLIHIQDISEFYRYLVTADLDGRSYNYGMENISLLELAKKIKDKLIIKDSVDNRSYKISSMRSKITFGIYPVWSLDTGIGEISSKLISGYYVDPSYNSMYYNVKRMKEIGLT